MYSQYRIVKKTGLTLRYFVLLFIFSDYYDNPVLNVSIGDGDYVTDKFPYADLKPSYNLSNDTLDYNTK